MLIGFDQIPSGANVSAADRDKARVFAAICESEDATRKRLAARMKLRPTTVSQLVKELIEDGVIRESQRVDAERQGRPEILLQPCPERFCVLMVHVVSHDIRCSLVDMAGRVISEDMTQLNDKEADNRVIYDRICALVDSVRAHAPEATEILGIGIAVPGIIDSANRRWVYSARWPAMRSLSFDEIADHTGLSIRADRNLNLELTTRLMRKPEEREGGVLFIHWGYGIGSAYAWKGMVIESSIGSFGEFGHWSVHAGAGRQCHCGEEGCLEAVAALWALLPEIREQFPDAPSDESAFEAYMKQHGLSGHPAIVRAVEAFIPALANLNKAFFADRIVLTGPLASSPEIFERLRQGFDALMPEYARGKCALYLARQGAQDVTQGATLPFFQSRMHEIFLRHD
ncbi:ROK family transcriptional regulator [Martelella radicis]|uniref:Transcriptional regulator of PTS protein n=1 Tax=Martelella radicis TaxID=1397476 RepID=A0A7W6KR75_9HYPH|nr:ROK family transcriptional regulator [Martelella radicis]MBB4124610.1 transcriptional regulator of PTS gene [Martelella radicis]